MRSINSARGSTLVVALITVMVVAMVTGHILLRISAQLETAHRSTAWNEALTTAESAVDMTVADLTALLPDIRVNSSEGMAVGTSQLPATFVSSLGVGVKKLSLQEGVTLSYQPTTLQHGGEGSGRQEATVFLDVVPLSQLLGSGALQLAQPGALLANPLGGIKDGDLQLVRLRARGTVAIPSRRADRDSLDAELRRATLVWDRDRLQRALRASISREIEVFLKPVFPFQSAVTSSGSFKSQSSGAVYDSFNSLLPSASTMGKYDPEKFLRNGDVNAYHSDVALAGMIYGDLRTAGAVIQDRARISGTVENCSPEPLPLVRTPTWIRTPLSPTEITVSRSLSAGTVLLPARYKFDRITAPLVIKSLPGITSDVEIWVTGDITGSITIEPGVRAKIYVQGDVSLPSGNLVNGSNVASNLLVYGLPDGDSSTARDFQLGLGDVSAAIYAPTHNVKLTGSGHFQGAITCAQFVSDGNSQVHFDEALSLNVGSILRFEVASWTERKF